MKPQPIQRCRKEKFNISFFFLRIIILASRMEKCSSLGCWRSRDRRRLTGRDSTRNGFYHFISNLTFNYNFRYRRSPLAVLVMKNVWRCLKIKYKKCIYYKLFIINTYISYFLSISSLCPGGARWWRTYIH